MCVRAWSVFSPAPTVNDVDDRLRQAAKRAGGTAIVNVRYQRGAPWAPRRALRAIGIAVLLERQSPPAENDSSAASE